MREWENHCQNHQYLTILFFLYFVIKERERGRETTVILIQVKSFGLIHSPWGHISQEAISVFMFIINR